ncbi:hypothetical protein J807_1942 [Acinetobacter sp. 25977_4]|nr:hypothetical protein J525_0626 [Acinetobacter sp. 21871]EXT38797.1 hypothetical protein J811_1785 [Acinetobacter sp. 25977_8]EXT50642.1 hypothetical protein J807_1942 [Acinetobacter sp. 25977_4]EXT61102.1 hypothetical protein J805_0392 [Acinetobacter sp. 25977_2]EXT64112.1 hypothetical protein J804_0400 [Acinetobacter sp. 25977_1]KCY78934.1 hypothetical protein J732_0358 [Acinetobacter sp. 796380-1375]
MRLKSLYLFWEKKGTAKPIKTVLGTSQVLLLLSFRRNDLKPKKPYGDRAALIDLSCVEIVFDSDCQ